MYYTEGEINELMVEDSTPAKCSFTLKPSNDYVCQASNDDIQHIFLCDSDRSDAKIILSDKVFTVEASLNDFLLQAKVAHCKIRVYTLNPQQCPIEAKQISII